MSRKENQVFCRTRKEFEAMHLRFGIRDNNFIHFSLQITSPSILGWKRILFGWVLFFQKNQSLNATEENYISGRERKSPTLKD